MDHLHTPGTMHVACQESSSAQRRGRTRGGHLAAPGCILFLLNASSCNLQEQRLGILSLGVLALQQRISGRCSECLVSAL